jgi:glycosyltransferase involved in cell wall biosynthesis
MRRPVVVLDALLLRPQPTGVGRSILELTSALAAEDRGLDFVVLATHPQMLAAVAARPGWQVVACPTAAGGTLRKAAFTQVQMPGLLRRLGADLVHCLQFVAPLRAPCPVVLTVHDLGYLRFPGTVEEPRRSYYRLLVPRSLRRAAAVVCNSDATAADVREHFPAVAGRVRTTPFGAPSWVWSLPPAPTERQDDAPFLFVGTLEPRKNLERLLRAYRRCREERSVRAETTPRLVLVGGRGWKDSGLRALIEELRAVGAVEMHDYCDVDALWRLYGSARALLFPSLHEGFGFPILEAMAAGLPVLTSGCGAMAEVAGAAALLVDPLQEAVITAALHRLCDDAGLRQDLARRGPVRARGWTWQYTAAATAACYRDVLAGDGSSKQP